MYHTAKSGRRRKKGRLLRLCFLLVFLWAAMLGLLTVSWSVPSHPEECTLVFRGETYQCPANGKTAGQLLQELGLELTKQDITSLPPDTVLTANTVFTVTCLATRQEVYTIAIPPETQYHLDSTLSLGTQTVLIPGVAGELRCTAQVDYVNGLETHREIISQELVYPAQNELIALGTWENPSVTASSGYLWLPEGQVLTYTHTAQTEATGFTCTDAGALPGAQPGTVAADPDFIAPGTRLYIVSSDGSYLYGIAHAAASDAMEGKRIDLCFATQEEREQFGRRSCILYFLG